MSKKNKDYVFLKVRRNGNLREFKSRSWRTLQGAKVALKLRYLEILDRGDVAELWQYGRCRYSVVVGLEEEPKMFHAVEVLVYPKDHLKTHPAVATLQGARVVAGRLRRGAHLRGVKRIEIHHKEEGFIERVM